MMRIPTLFLCGSLVLGSGLCVPAAVLRVPGEYPTIQAGIDAAVDGDTVLVADGTYTGDGNRDIDFYGKAIVVISEHGPEATTIDCEGSASDPHRGFYFHSGEGSDAVLKGFTIKNGYAVGEWIEGCGGAILCTSSSPVIEDNIITDNTVTWDGGGILCRDSSPSIVGNLITGNAASMQAGGIDCHGGRPTIYGNTITGNTANHQGGGILYWWACSGPIVGNTILGNTAGEDGGGVYCGDESSPWILGNIIAGNASEERGGGICCIFSSPAIEGNTITRNRAVLEGGGLFCYASSFPTVLNCIFWEDSANSGPEISGSWITVTYSDVQHGWPGLGNIDADPLFVTGPHGDHYLSQIIAGQPVESPCVDAGDPSWTMPEGTTRTDEVCDVWPGDMGYHYYPCSVGPTMLLWVQVTPETTQVQRGEDLWFNADVVNLTDSTLAFDAWVDGYLLNGNPYGGNPVLGPVEIALGANQGLYEVHRHVMIPWAAPLGSPYKLCVRTGAHPDSTWAEDCFEFAIVPRPLE